MERTPYFVNAEAIAAGRVHVVRGDSLRPWPAPLGQGPARARGAAFA
jgi:hypothetical protein